MPKRQKTNDETTETRKYLKTFELLPSQLLNVYGRSRYHTMKFDDLWKNMSMPMKTGAAYATELCDASDERRGVGINRWAVCMRDFLKYQQQADVKKGNEYFLAADKSTKLYDEINTVLPSLEYTIAQQVRKSSKGAGGISNLRCGVSEQPPPEAKCTSELKKHVYVVYDWLAQPKSYVRMLHQWQACGGFSFVINVYNTATQAFVECGNSLHGEEGASKVSREEFLRAVQARHARSADDVCEEERQEYKD